MAVGDYIRAVKIAKEQRIEKLKRQRLMIQLQ